MSDSSDEIEIPAEFQSKIIEHSVDDFDDSMLPSSDLCLKTVVLPSNIQCLEVSRKHEYLLISTDDGKLVIIKYGEKLIFVKMFSEHQNICIRDVAVHSTGDLVCTLAVDSTLVIYDLRTLDLYWKGSIDITTSCMPNVFYNTIYAPWICCASSKRAYIYEVNNGISRKMKLSSHDNDIMGITKTTCRIISYDCQTIKVFNDMKGTRSKALEDQLNKVKDVEYIYATADYVILLSGNDSYMFDMNMSNFLWKYTIPPLSRKLQGLRRERCLMRRNVYVDKDAILMSSTSGIRCLRISSGRELKVAGAVDDAQTFNCPILIKRTIYYTQTDMKELYMIDSEQSKPSTTTLMELR